MKKTLRIALLVIGSLIFLLALTAYQPAPKAEVVAEGEGQCTDIQFYPGLDGTPVNDPKLGMIFRATVNVYSLNCGNQYVNYAKCVDVQDLFTDAQGNVTHFTSQFECITEKDGIWKGTCEAIMGVSTVCSGVGDGKYEGLTLYTDADLTTFIMKYKVTRAIEK